jgi:hypothetical protein
MQMVSMPTANGDSKAVSVTNVSPAPQRNLANLQVEVEADDTKASLSRSPSSGLNSSNNAALRDDVLLDVKYLKDVYQGLGDDLPGTH